MTTDSNDAITLGLHHRHSSIPKQKLLIVNPYKAFKSFQTIQIIVRHEELLLKIMLIQAYLVQSNSAETILPRGFPELLHLQSLRTTKLF